MASTPQELLNSMMMTSLLSVDFTSIATKAIEKSYIYIKPKKMKFARMELIFG